VNEGELLSSPPPRLNSILLWRLSENASLKSSECLADIVASTGKTLDESTYT
jgi:hypothetical protein